MTLDDVRKNYTESELSDFPGDDPLRFQAFSPFLQNLFEDKVVYCEHYMWIVHLRDLRISEEGFRVTAVPNQYILRRRIVAPDPPQEPWDFGGGWKWIRLVGHSLNCFPGGWSIWPEAGRVQAVEQCL